MGAVPIIHSGSQREREREEKGPTQPPPPSPWAAKKGGVLLRFSFLPLCSFNPPREVRIESILLDSFATRPPSDTRGCRALSFLIPTENIPRISILLRDTDLILYDDETKDTQTKGTRTISSLSGLRQHRSSSLPSFFFFFFRHIITMSSFVR